MINEKKAREYCNEDISKIENYDKAIADDTQTWHCHHRRESIVDRQTLIENGEYYHRSSSELIFLTESEHKAIHKPHLGHKHSDETKRKMSEARRGKGCPGRHWHLSDESKRKIGLAKMGNQACKGKVWANNGVVSKMFNPDSIPTGWSLGRISWKVSP